VRITGYICTLCRHKYLSNDVPVVIWVGKIAYPDNAEGVNDRVCEYFAIDQQQIECGKHLQSQYGTSC
jgi:hypothetical protein